VKKGKKAKAQAESGVLSLIQGEEELPMDIAKMVREREKCRAREPQAFKGILMMTWGAHNRSNHCGEKLWEGKRETIVERKRAGGRGSRG